MNLATIRWSLVAAHSDVPLYIGIAVAVVVFLAGAAVVYKLLQKKTRDHSLYTMTRTGNYDPHVSPKTYTAGLSHPNRSRSRDPNNVIAPSCWRPNVFRFVDGTRKERLVRMKFEE